MKCYGVQEAYRSARAGVHGAVGSIQGASDLVVAFRELTGDSEDCWDSGSVRELLGLMLTGDSVSCRCSVCSVA